MGAVVLLGIVVAGWWELWFLCDDAYIAFRYVSNHAMGYGWTWNPPPFQPVEGYTSFLWVALLQLVWAWTGLAPPQAANPISLLFGLGTLAIVARTAWRLPAPEVPEVARRVLLGLALLGIATNKTFLMWLSSGLETSLFVFLFTWWVAAGLTPGARRGPVWLLSLATAAALLSLARPDGLLAVAATVVIAAAHLAVDPKARWTELVGLAPLLATPTHLVWRRLTYGEWLPNTYYAKHVAMWPEAGLAYLASFILEYGLWFGFPIALAATIWLWRRRTATWRQLLIPGLALATVGAHLAYYTLSVGGDHFEYRVYAQLVPWWFVGMAWVIGRASGRRWRLGAGLVAAAVVLALPIPWSHHLATRSLTTREQTRRLVYPLAPHVLVVPQLWAWDGLQKYLVGHNILLRHREHVGYEAYQQSIYPDREHGSQLGQDQRVILVRGGVGVPSWNLPNVMIIDRLGLNDRVVARAPMPRSKSRQMAHDRRPPKAYVECFRPNLYVGKKGVHVTSRIVPATDDEIRACEARDWLSGDSGAGE